ncbi:hypothetical protein V8C42DRAFT_106875 [Trichoderma barbatum]
MNEHSLIRHQFHHLTYPSLRLNDHNLDDNLPSFQPQPEKDGFCPQSTTNIGALDALPPELIQKILSQLDLRTLADFRLVNRRARELVNFVPEYNAITTHAHNALRGILSIKTGRWITCNTLYERLCTPKCEQCGDFGGYLYLITCKRVCFLCLSHDRLFLPLVPRHVNRKFGLDHQIFRRFASNESHTWHVLAKQEEGCPVCLGRL